MTEQPEKAARLRKTNDRTAGKSGTAEENKRQGSRKQRRG